jgi:hypothetical protein
MPRLSDFAVGQRVRVYPSSSDERLGIIVEDFAIRLDTPSPWDTRA